MQYNAMYCNVVEILSKYPIIAHADCLVHSRLCYSLLQSTDLYIIFRRCSRLPSPSIISQIWQTTKLCTWEASQIPLPGTPLCHCVYRHYVHVLALRQPGYLRFMIMRTSLGFDRHCKVIYEPQHSLLLSSSQFADELAIFQLKLPVYLHLRRSSLNLVTMRTPIWGICPTPLGVCPSFKCYKINLKFSTSVINVL